MPVGFVGTVSTRRSTHVQLDVEEVWQGPDLAPQVWVVDGGGDGGEEVGVDWVAGERFLVLADEAFETNDCIAMRTSDVAGPDALAPATVRAPRDDGAQGAVPPDRSRVAGAIAAATCAVVLLTVARWRRRRGSAA